ncbi:hypothetical protein SDC9_57781 [bioreactor metagenome]|uniref:HTH cro/C1-type domain-containing protein n=1 Tax=bioreactor metagenome TaxID=1076179 RepID=A0A644X658_9ZZZZ
MSYFSDRLKALRTEHGLTQKQIADEIGISQGTYSSLENGKSEPSLDTLKAFSSYYNEYIDSLVSCVGIVFEDEEQLSPEEWRLLKKYERLSRNDQIEVECIIDMKLRKSPDKEDN